MTYKCMKLVVYNWSWLGFMLKFYVIGGLLPMKMYRAEQNRTEQLQNRTEQNRTEQNRTEQNRTEQNRTEQNSKFPRRFATKFSKFEG